MEVELLSSLGTIWAQVSETVSDPVNALLVCAGLFLILCVSWVWRDEYRRAESARASEDLAGVGRTEVSTPTGKPPTPPATIPGIEDQVSVRGRLSKTRTGLLARIREAITGKAALDDTVIEELEAVMVQADMGVNTAQRLLAGIQEQLPRGSITYEELVSKLEARVREILAAKAPAPGIDVIKPIDGPMVIAVVGVNGAGKTTTIAKLTQYFKARGHSVMLIAGDTFRAAAVEQLKVWADRLGAVCVSGAADAKPSTVVFEGMTKAKELKADVVLIDTAGRLHTKSNLMQELEGVFNMIRRHQPSAPHETILVLDGSAGQNALRQAKEFHQSLGVTGAVVTKLDGTPKGGMVVAIKEELGIPVRFLGLGERASDLKPFVPEEFARALFAVEA